jgi:hypothetical protein
MRAYRKLEIRHSHIQKRGLLGAWCLGLLSELQSRLYALNLMMRPQTNRTPPKTTNTVALVSAALR